MHLFELNEVKATGIAKRFILLHLSRTYATILRLIFFFAPIHGNAGMRVCHQVFLPSEPVVGLAIQQFIAVDKLCCTYPVPENDAGSQTRSSLPVRLSTEQPLIQNPHS